MQSAIFSFLAAAIFVFVLMPAEARAEPPPHVAVRLEYTIGRGAEVCPAESVLRTEIARRLGYDPFTLYAPARLVATFARTGGGLTASAQFFDEAGKPGWARTYRVPDDDCAALVSGMGSEASFMLDPFVLPSTAPPPPAPPPLPAVAPPVHLPSSSAPPADRRPPPPPTFSPRGELAIGPQFAIGMAPGVAFGASLHGAVRLLPLFRLGAELRLNASPSSTVSMLPGVTYRILMVGGSVLSCVHGGLAFGCGVVSVAWVHGAADGLDVSRPDSGIYVGTGLRGGLEGRMSSRFAARLYGEGQVALRRIRIVLDSMEVWRMTPVSATVGASFVTFF